MIKEPDPTRPASGAPWRIAIVGVGKIARDQHLPALAASDGFDPVACVDPNAASPGLPTFISIQELLAAGIPLDAVSICTPPAARPALAAAAIEAGLHVMLEKPPAATASELADLAAAARSRRVTLFATWHSREASGVAPARAWLAGRTIRRVTIDWREDIRRWHPGQDWILGPDGFGVFDPGINALSILTVLLSDPVALTGAKLVVPDGRQSPIAAALDMAAGSVPITAAFDFRQDGPQTWDIRVDTDDGPLLLREGGSVLEVEGRIERGANAEYPRLYHRFADLIDRGVSDVDDTPLRLVHDALRIGAREPTDAFAW